MLLILLKVDDECCDPEYPEWFECVRKDEWVVATLATRSVLLLKEDVAT
jgi:hypothetical protein